MKAQIDICSGIYQKMQARQPISDEEYSALKETMSLLDKGDIRVTEKESDWIVYTWIKEAIVAYIYYTTPVDLNYGIRYHDHTPYKYIDKPVVGARVVPSAFVRFGAYIGKQVIIMPSFINTGAYVDDGTMIDTYASIGSCAHIGKNCHISAGAGIGGVLEPLQAMPTIIEDNCFIGARSEISEGVIVRQGAVLASGLFISASTRIYNRLTKETTYGEIPANAVVVPGTVPSKDGDYQINAAIIVKFADMQTRSKTKLNLLLRDL